MADETPGSLCMRQYHPCLNAERYRMQKTLRTTARSVSGEYAATRRIYTVVRLFSQCSLVMRFVCPTRTSFSKGTGTSSQVW